MLRGGAVGLAWCGFVTLAWAGGYRDSAHGNAGYGVTRAAVDSKYAEYATGNCGHCHEAHASVDGVEPQPLGAAAPHALFAAGFNTGRTLNPYTESDGFCFFCHGGTGPQVVNRDYSAVFGGAVNTGPQSILAAFNQSSYHNLYDVWNFLRNKQTTYPWFGLSGNPCSACHNSHLAKRNFDPSKPGFPLLSAISSPVDHQKLWGETQLMFSYTSYEAPYASALVREPGGLGDPDGRNTPDYASFCSSCHNRQDVVWSTTLSRNLAQINWLTTGVLPKPDKHGVTARQGAGQFRPPYAGAAGTKSNFVLSCLDCHDSHGSSNIMLLRRRINGEDLEGPVTSTDAMGLVCKRCHKDDLAAAAGTAQANKWQYVHHGAPTAPYVTTPDCTACHSTADGKSPIPCGNCHGHGKDDSWAGTGRTGWATF